MDNDREEFDIRGAVSKKHFDKLIEKKYPDWISPMLATLTHDVFSDDQWIYERKFDGERCIIYKQGKNIRLATRNKKEIGHRYPEIRNAISDVRCKNIIIDGEIVAFDGKVTSFSKLQKRMHLHKEEEIRASGIKVYYYIFDIMYAQDFELTQLPLRERKKILNNIIDFKDPLRYSIYRNKEGSKFFDEACQRDWEGIIAKRADSGYIQSRSRKWLKFKCSKSQEFLIIGYTDPKGHRIGFGALLIGYYAGDKLKYAGKVGTGFDESLLRSLYDRLKELEKEGRTIDSKEISGKNIHWVKPELVCQVGFTEWTDDGKLRHPRFKGLREDKEPREVVDERKRDKN